MYLKETLPGLLNTFVHEGSIHICVCTCVSKRLIITSGVYHWLSKFYDFVWQLRVDVDSQLKHVIEINPIRVMF